MDGKIFGIPLVLILIVFFIAMFVNVPMVLLHMTTQERLERIEINQASTQGQVEKVRQAIVVTPTETVEPTPTVAPTKSVRQPVRSATPSGQVN